jgi:electron transfer flavoprotein alpha subunit
MGNSIFVFAEQREGKFKKVAYEALSLARKLADQLGTGVEASIIGDSIGSLAGEPRNYGADKINIVEEPSLKDYFPAAYRDILVSQIKESGAKIILLGSTALGLDLAPRIGAALGVSAATDCVNVDLKDNQLTALRSVYVGKALARVKFEEEPAVLTLRTNIFPIEKNEGKGEIVKKEASSALSAPGIMIKEIIKSSQGKKDVEEADIIVAGGRGMKGPENFSLLEELASLLGAAIGASRSVVDAGWRSHDDQIGQTGKTVSPNLYIACGISGSIQHLAGMSSSKYIVAINKDPDAPIFKAADYGIVGDLFEVVPRLTEEVKKILGS